jgi:hypothetical protein
MEYSSRQGENVLDLFGGSGSTLIAAEQTGRKAFLMELDPLYCDVIVTRYEQFTGKKATLAAGTYSPRNLSGAVRTCHFARLKEQAMAQKGKRRADHKLLMALACGATAENAARQVGVSESTVFRRLTDADFVRRLRAIRADMVQRTAGTLTAAGAEAVRALLELLKGARAEAVRLGAARSVLEIGMKAREFAELDERLAALEDQAELNARGPYMESPRGSMGLRRDVG